MPVCAANRARSVRHLGEDTAAADFRASHNCLVSETRCDKGASDIDLT